MEAPERLEGGRCLECQKRFLCEVLNMKIVSITWNSYIPLLYRAAQRLELEVEAYSSRTLENNPEKIEEALEACESADLVLLYHTSNAFWDELDAKIEVIKKRVPVVYIGNDPYCWTLSSVKPEIAAKAYLYIAYNGEENIVNLLQYVRKEVLGLNVSVEAPKKIAWEGLYHPDANKNFENIEEYLGWSNPIPGKTVGVLISRTTWINNDLEIENTLIRALENRGLSVIPVFSYSLKDKELGTKGMKEVIQEYFIKDGKTLIDCLVKLSPFFIMSTKGSTVNSSDCAEQGTGLLKELDVPLIQPIASSYMTLEEWEKSNGLSNDIGWSVALPEFEGVIEPVLIGAGKPMGNYVEHAPLEERCLKLAARIEKWIRLRSKPASEKKIAFLLHNKPCASVEGGVGEAAYLDSLESVAGILHRMQKEGYNVNPPADGRELIDMILSKKAISEFRWTPVEEIVRKGGALALVEKEEYEKFFKTLSPAVRDRMVKAWGNPPGEKVNGMPAAMVHEGKIVVTGVQFGNAVVCLQPKRGCAGSGCNGQVCRILHDPDIPPTHQYLATYRYLEDTFGADAIVHVGTHGNLEFLPGKGTGLSGDCYPDIAIGTLPHLYIYNSDNPPEGTIAKRRSLACLVDHMQTVMAAGGLYDELEELDRLLGEYEQVKHDHAREHALKHLVMDEIKKTKLDSEIGLKPDHEISFPEIIRRTHEALSKIRNTQIPEGMHIFGSMPQGEKRIEFINSILRYEDSEPGSKGSIRRFIAGMLDFDFDSLLSGQGEVSKEGRSNGQILEEIDLASRDFIRVVLNGKSENNSSSNLLKEILKTRFSASGLQFSPEKEVEFAKIRERILDIDSRIEASKEIEALLHGLEGGYILPGPSGLIMRGRDDVLPTGRNFYSLDPRRVPTKAAWRVGRKLAEALITRYLQEEGKIPENVAFYWMANDIMWADGECMAQVMSLLGVEPTWKGNGQLKGFSVIPLEILGRPRIDVTIRTSGILRDNFPGCMEIIDEAVQAVAGLEEPPEMNYLRKHTLEMLAQGNDQRTSTLRIFSSKPGTYSAGVQLAIYASAWKDEKDLADIFLYWNGYAYGQGVHGKEAHTQLAQSLKTVDVTFNKIVSDEYDLLGCCCYFGTHGGMTAAAKQASGKDVKAYYGDTREPAHVEVRGLAEELRRVVRSRLLNPKWIEGMKEHGYRGASEISKRVGTIYGWEASTQAVDDWIFDEVTNTFVLDMEMRAFFEENNPYALEEISRRLLEAEARKLWNPDPELLDKLKGSYLEIERRMEELAGEGEFQGGTVDIFSIEDVPDWNTKMQEIRKKIH